MIQEFDCYGDKVTDENEKLGVLVSKTDYAALETQLDMLTKMNVAFEEADIALRKKHAALEDQFGRAAENSRTEHAALDARCQQAEKERDALNDQAADNAEGVCYETLHGLSTRSVDFGDPWRVEGVPQNVDDDLADMDTIGTVEYWEDSGDRSVGIPNTNGLSFKPAEGVCLITRDSLLTISQERDDLRDALRELGQQAKSALDIYDKEIMITTLKAVIAAAERVK